MRKFGEQGEKSVSGKVRCEGVKGVEVTKVGEWSKVSESRSRNKEFEQ